jgi:hypothetical protein
MTHLQVSAASTGSTFNAFAGGAELAAQLAALPISPFYETRATNRLRDINLRAAGPVVRLPAGPLSLNLTAELRDERAPGAISNNYLSTPALRSTTVFQAATQTVGSAFAEARIPITGMNAHPPLLRGLEAQIAVRGDRYRISVPLIDSQLTQLGLYGDKVSSRGTVVAVTTSLRASPIDGLEIRGSYANGYTPPTQTQITPSGFSFGFFPYADPKRPRDSIFSSTQTLLLYGGTPRQRPQKTTTWSFGAIAKPSMLPGLRMSADFSILRSIHVVTDFAAGQFQYFVTNEDLYPGRIQRAALTPADIASGYTAGRIIRVDASNLSTGTSTLNALDGALQYEHGTDLGRLSAYAQGTWEPKLRRGARGAGSYDTAGSLNGPLTLRGSGGVEVSRHAWSAGLDAQVYGSYRVTYSYQPGSVLAGAYPSQNVLNVLEQGSSRIPAQAYLDGWTSLSSEVNASGGRHLTISYRLGVKNLMNKMPPTVVPPLTDPNDGSGYSSLGDPRGRRFEVQISARY